MTFNERTECILFVAVVLALIYVTPLAVVALGGVW